MNHSYDLLKSTLPNFLSFDPHEHTVFEPISYDIVNDLKSKDNSFCPICLYVPNIYFRPNSCFHRFCKRCLSQWSERKKICPLCRKSFIYILKT